VAAVALVLAACGSNSKPSSTATSVGTGSSTSVGSSPTSSVSGTPYKLMYAQTTPDGSEKYLSAIE
jgi:hypothetical protein